MDIIQFEVLEDGTLKITTDEISGENHMNAEEFLKWLAQELGGEVKRVKRGHGSHTHVYVSRKKQAQ